MVHCGEVTEFSTNKQHFLQVSHANRHLARFARTHFSTFSVSSILVLQDVTTAIRARERDAAPAGERERERGAAPAGVSTAV